MARLEQFGRRNVEEWLHPTIDMDPQVFEIFTAIGPTCRTSPTVATAIETLNGTPISGLNPSVVLTDLNHFNPQLMAENSGKTICGMFSLECVEIAAADPNAMDSNQSLARPH